MTAMEANAPAEPRGRKFSFRCLRCSSILEASASQCGSTARCPSCDALFTVPPVDPDTGGAARDADPGEDGELPAPVHAYAAAGANAPRIIRHDDDRLEIECPRCSNRSPVIADNCVRCGLPFTMEGATGRASSDSSSGTVALALGIIALVCGFCPIVGIIPGIAAIILGARGLNRPGYRRHAIAGLCLGIAGCIISLATVAMM